MTTKIRLARAADAAQIQAIYAPIVAETTISFEQVVPTVEEMAERIEKTTERYPWLACADGETITGYVYATSHRTRAAYQWSVDVSVYVHPNYRRRGMGRALYTALFKVLAAQGFYNAYAGIALPNPGSIGVHEAVGFVPVGVYKQVGYKLGAWHDVGWWQLALQPKDAEPQTPIPISDLVDSVQWNAAIDAGLALLK
jgi:phosphinothricin acetyltransferase